MLTLGTLAERDAPGDPVACCQAHAAAERAGPPYARAFDLLNRLRDSTHELREHGRSVPELPAAAMALLQTAARAEPVDEAELRPVLRQGQLLADKLGWEVMRLPRNRGNGKTAP
jgi:hypothetical protein